MDDSGSALSGGAATLGRIIAVFLQIPRLYNVYKKNGMVDSFQDIIDR
jgi:hypothetical protein